MSVKGRLEKRGKKEKILLLPMFGEMHSSRHKKRSESSITLLDLKISVILTLPAPSPGVNLNNIIGHGPSLH